MVPLNRADIDTNPPYVRPLRKFSRSTGWKLFGFGMAGTLLGIILLVLSLSKNSPLTFLGDPKSLVFPLIALTLVSWVTSKFGKTIIKVHDQDEIDLVRFQESDPSAKSRSSDDPDNE